MGVPSVLGNAAALAAQAGLGQFIVDQVEKKITDIKQEAAGESQTQGLSALQTHQLFNELANTLKVYTNNPIYTDPIKLRAFIGANSELFAPNSEWPKILQAMKSFLDAGTQASVRIPYFADKVIKYVFRTYSNTGDAATVIKRLEDLKEKALDVEHPKDAYISAILEDNYALASVLILMSNLNTFDNNTFKQLADINTMATQMLGPKSFDLLKAQALRREKSRTNWYKLEKSLATFDLLLPVAMTSQNIIQRELNILTGIVKSDFAKNIVDDPFIRAVAGAVGAAPQLIANFGDKSLTELFRGTR